MIPDKVVSCCPLQARLVVSSGQAARSPPDPPPQSRGKGGESLDGAPARTRFPWDGTQYLVGFLRLHAHPGALDEVLRLAGKTRGADELADDRTWSSYQQFRGLFAAAGVVLAGQRRLADVGLGAWDLGPKSNPEWLEMLRTLGSPGKVFAAATAYSSLWPLLRVEGEEIGPTERVMRHTFKAGFAPFKEFCCFFPVSMLSHPRCSASRPPTWWRRRGRCRSS
jgi:hypothetical protein